VVLSSFDIYEIMHGLSIMFLGQSG